MTPDVTMLVAGNWKMNGLSGDLETLSQMMAGWDNATAGTVDGAICVPATLVAQAANAAKASPIAIGGQDCHSAASGAHTGDISAAMLADAGATTVIVGHSERRADHGETDAQIAAKAEAVHEKSLIAIICVGETQEEREAGRAGEVVASQLAASVPDGATAANTVVAYEPVWAIGTGLTASPEDIGEIHKLIRDALAARFADGARFRILYGGSVKPGNAAEIFAVPNVDGALVGGASLKSDDYLAISKAAAGVGAAG